MKCISCGSDSWTPKYAILTQCNQCELIRAKDFPSEEELAALYDESYFEGAEYASYTRDIPIAKRNFENRYKQISKQGNRLDNGLEIGCAHGVWLSVLRGHNKSAMGIDISDAAVAYAVEHHEADAHVGRFLDYDFKDRRFDSICMWDTIEHLSQPDAFLRKCFDLLNPSGIMCLTTGDIGALSARVAGRRWRMIHPPTHLYYFSRKTISSTLQQCGFQVDNIVSESMFRSLAGSFGGLRVLGNGFTRGIGMIGESTLEKLGLGNVGFWLNLGDIMRVVARKPEGALADA